ncbi:MAG: acyl-[acyl-carrier-protein]--UDP-N-acetylglucosamine O-acyltransferase, partial [Pseudomonadota bacterium]
IGTGAILGAGCLISQDIVPYGFVMTRSHELLGLNLKGLKRAGYSRQQIQELDQVFKALFMNLNGNFTKRASEISAQIKSSDNILLKNFAAFICQPSQRGFLLPPHQKIK